MRMILVGLFGCLLVGSGCGRNAQVTSAIELMNAERRALEDQLYELEFQYESAVDKLEELQTKNEELRDQLDDGGSRGSRGSSSSGSGRRRDSTSDSDPDDTDLSPPMIDEGELTIPQIEIPNIDQGAELVPPGQSAVLARRSRVPPADPHVTRLRINSRLTQGVDLDDQPGDDGLEIVLEPLNEAGEVVVLPGPIDVVVLDYAFRDQGEAARIASWNLEASDVARFIQDTPQGEGIRLQLMWPERPPKHSQLRLDVRYETLDGRKLDARRDVNIRLPSSYSQRWTPRASAGIAERPAKASAIADRPDDSEVRPASNETRPDWKPFR